MNGLTIGSGKIEITEGARVTFSTDGTLINLLPTAYDKTGTIAVTFPDFTKDNAYIYRHVGSSLDPVRQEYCRSFVSMLPQEWSGDLSLGTVPAEVDFLDVLVKLSRTTNPSNIYGGAMPKCVPENVWFDMSSASALLERTLGMGRAFTIELNGTDIRLRRQQSCTEPPEGWEAGNNAGPSGVLYGIESWTYGGAKGIPIYVIDTKDPGPFGDPFSKNKYRGASQQCSLTDPTNYAETWTLEYNIALGCRTQGGA